MCNFIKFVWLGCEKQPKLTQKWPKKQPFFDIFDFRKNSIRFERNFVQSIYSILWSFVCNFVKFVLEGYEKQPKLTYKWQKKQSFFGFIRISQKLSIRSERNSLQSFYTILESYNGIKIVWLVIYKSA